MQKILIFFLFTLIVMAQSVPTRLVKSDDGFSLTRNGKPFFIKGVGGKHHLEQLAAAGANSIRTWGADNIDSILDDAHKNGLTVTIGFWLGHERHGFDYQKAEAVARQKEQCRQAILKYRNHPALLMWAVGNEMEAAGTNPAIWYAVDDIARMCKDLDPDHPTMTVIAEVWPEKIQAMNQFLRNIDVVGINTYGGCPSIGQRYREAGGHLPYVVTEFGPPGQWETGKTDWGAPYEMSSTEKAAFYEKAYREGVLEEKGLALGSYAFLWGFKQEATATWYGLFLKDDSRTQAIENLTALWGGPAPENRAPRLSSIEASKTADLQPGETITASVQVSDPDGDELKLSWILRRESGLYATGGDDQPDQPEFPDAIQTANAGTCKVSMPESGGPYRLFLYAHDGKGCAAVANIPLKVEGPVKPVTMHASKVPVAVYADGHGSDIWIPSGYMGNTGAISMDLQNTSQPAAGKTCIKVEFRAKEGWGGVVWQSPANDWGDQPGGRNLSAANVLRFQAKGELGDEVVSFGVGLIGADKPHADSTKASMKDVVLTKEWKNYVIPLSNRNLSQIKSGFYWTLGAAGKPVTFYLDEILFDYDEAQPPARKVDVSNAKPSVDLPVAVYEESKDDLPWIPSGYMGDAGAIAMNPESTTQPHAGQTCMEVSFDTTHGWGGVVWQSPANDWGDQPGGVNLTGASHLTFWVRGGQGGESISFSMGLIGEDKPYPDSGKAEKKDVVLTTEWQKIDIPLAGQDLSCIKTGFAWVTASHGQPVKFYLDSIRYE